MVRSATQAQDPKFAKEVAIFKERGGILRTSQALCAGVHPTTFYAMRDTGVLEVVSRGVYRLASEPPLGNPDLVAVAARVPSGVICLISALAFHGLTTQIPTRSMSHWHVVRRNPVWSTRRSEPTGSPERHSQRAWKDTNSMACLCASTARKRRLLTASNSGTGSDSTRRWKPFASTGKGRPSRWTTSCTTPRSVE